jgi:hypothetical protein
MAAIDPLSKDQFRDSRRDTLGGGTFLGFA